MGRSEAFKRKYQDAQAATRRKKPVELPPLIPPQPPPLVWKYKPKNDLQRSLADMWEGNSLFVVVGDPGTGKTTGAVGMAVADLLAGKVKRVVVIRPTVAVDESLGFVKGTLQEKLAPWFAAFGDVMGELGMADLARLDGKLFMEPLGMIQGRTFHEAVVIVDEAQHATEQQIEIAATRGGRGTKTVFCGSDGQGTRRRGDGSPLGRLVKAAEGMPGGVVLRAGADDQLRSAAVNRFLAAWRTAGGKK